MTETDIRRYLNGIHGQKCDGCDCSIAIQAFVWMDTSTFMLCCTLGCLETANRRMFINVNEDLCIEMAGKGGE